MTTTAQVPGCSTPTPMMDQVIQDLFVITCAFCGEPTDGHDRCGGPRGFWTLDGCGILTCADPSVKTNGKYCDSCTEAREAQRQAWFHFPVDMAV